ncbi:MAG: S8 family peptidase [Actinomycetota bacterium]
MRHRVATACALVILLAVSAPAFAATGFRDRRTARVDRPAADVSTNGARRYFVQLDSPAALERGPAPADERSAAAATMRSQAAAIGEAEALGGTVVFRYSMLVNAFSVQLTAEAAAELAARPDIALVEPVPTLVAHNASSVPFIGAKQTWKDLGVRGQGITVAVVDTGVDYTHADFTGPGTRAASVQNDPAVIEPGPFPTDTVRGGYDFVGDDYSVIDDDPSNDLPNPDPDPLDDAVVGDHGTHVAGTCCGVGVRGEIGRGVAPRAKILAVKVWDDGNSTADVLVAGYEFAMDPNGDGSTEDAVDVLSFSGGVDYGPPSSVEAEAAQAVVDGGTVFVASAGNSGHQFSGGNGYILGTPASAPGVIAVASSLDEFASQLLTVEEPSGVELPDSGSIAWQEWSVPFGQPITGELVDARGFDEPADPDGVPVPTDRLVCEPPSGSPFEGKIALIFKGPLGEGDCAVEEKVIAAQAGGAIAVVIWDGFGGLAGQIGTGGREDEVEIPAVDLSGADRVVLAGVLSPDAPTSYNDETVTVTLGVDLEIVPGYADTMSAFSSEGPARITSALKPDITAPGDSITSANAGTGDGSLTIGGTSMAAPHVSGSAALLVQLHPDWSPEKIKALLMNQATQNVSELDGTAPVPATVQGAGRVQVHESAVADSLAWPGSVSFGLLAASELTTSVRTFTLENLSEASQRYRVRGSVRYHENLPAAFASVRVAVGDEQLALARNVQLGPGENVDVHVELTLDPDVVVQRWQELGWFFFNPNVDGNVRIRELGRHGDRFHVPWHVSPLAVADTDVPPATLDLTDGPADLAVSPDGAGVPYADVYLLGAEDPVGDEAATGEGDLVAVGARTFVGARVNGRATGIPPGAEPLIGLPWPVFLWNASPEPPTEIIEFGVVGADVHNITETTQVEVFVDVGADGVFADDGLQADYVIRKGFDGHTGGVCVDDLSTDADECGSDAYFQDYSNFNASIWGLPVDAADLGLTNDVHVLSYSVRACSGVYAGDVPDDLVCDTVGEIEPSTGTYGPTIDVTDPALSFSKLVVRGFWRGGPGPVTVSAGSAGAGDDPGILVLFPNNPPDDQWRVVPTNT